MAQEVDINSLSKNMKILVDGNPCNIVELDFVKPGKGQAFTRARVKNLISGRVIEKTYKSNETIPLADVEDLSVKLLYTDADGAHFMNEESFEQIFVGWDIIADNKMWLKEELNYDLVFHNGRVITLAPPTFLELKITQSDPGVKGDTAGGRVLKAAKLETGADVQVPIFIEEGEVIRVDTRTGEYVSRVNTKSK